MDIDLNNKKYQKLLKKYAPTHSLNESPQSNAPAASMYKSQPEQTGNKTRLHSPGVQKKKRRVDQQKSTKTGFLDTNIPPNEDSLVNHENEEALVELSSYSISSTNDGTEYIEEHPENSLSESHIEHPNAPNMESTPTTENKKKMKFKENKDSKGKRLDVGTRFVQSPKMSDRPIPKTVEKLTSQLNFSVFPNKALLYIPKYCSFALKGRVRLTVLKGDVEIMGAVCKASDKSYEIYSPRGYSLVVVNCLGSISDFDFATFLRNKNVDMDKTVDVNEVLLFLEKIDNKIVKFFDEHVTENLLRNDVTLESNLSGEEVKSHKELSRQLQCNVITKNYYLRARYYEGNHEWRDIVGSITELSNSSHCRVALCGGKGVGKSTLLKYLVNSLLQYNNEVLIIDVDPGQSEFTLPTCLSVLSTKEPIFGPNYTHLTKPEKCIYLGMIDVAKCMRNYINAVAQLIRWFVKQKQYVGKPCIINTMGFNSGVGVDLLVDTLRLSNPSHVVEVGSRAVKRNYPFQLDPHLVSIVQKGILTKPSPGDFFLNYEHIRVQSMSESAAQPVGEWGHRPASLREYVVLSYLSQLLRDNIRPSQAVNSSTPIRIPFSKVAVSSVVEKVKPQFILNALNGSLVSLCIADLETMNISKPDDPSLFSVVENFTPVDCLGFEAKPDDPSLFSVVENFTPVDCLGFGIIKRIDVEERLFYIVTPERDISNVNLICLGQLFLPESIYTGGNDKTPFELNNQPGGTRITVPYVAESLTKEGISQPWKKYSPYIQPRIN